MMNHIICELRGPVSGQKRVRSVPLRPPTASFERNSGAPASDMYVPSRPSGAIATLYSYNLGDQIASPTDSMNSHAIEPNSELDRARANGAIPDMNEPTMRTGPKPIES